MYRILCEAREQSGYLRPGSFSSFASVVTLPGWVKDALRREMLTKQQKPSLEGRKLSLPVYGNHCGLGHGDPTGNTPPIDAVDAVCREHDLCYALLGDFDGRCDQDFIECMPRAIASTPSPVGKNAGFLSLLYFSLAERNLALGETLFKRTNLERRGEIGRA